MNPLLVGPILDIAGKAFDRIFPDKTAAEKAKLEMLATLQTQDFQLALEQIKTNAAEAQGGNATWRPFIGKVCGWGLAYNFLAYPALCWIAAYFFPDVTPPTVDVDVLMYLVGGMLGLGAMRTAEKIKKAA